MKVKRSDGTVVEVNDAAYVLQDGETLMTEVRFMDGTRSLITDAHGSAAGQRPGFLFGDNEADERAVEAAHREYAATISERWRQPQGQRSNQTQPEPQTFANPEAARAAAYEEYSRTIQERWRR